MKNINIDQAAGPRRQKLIICTVKMKQELSGIRQKGSQVRFLTQEKLFIVWQRLNFINEFESSFCNLESSCLEATFSNF